MRGTNRRVFDLTVCILAGLMLGPFFLIALLLTWIFSGRPLFFQQIRVGMEDKEFVIFKIRTMELDAESRHSELVRKHGRLSDSFFIPGDVDPRITRIGKIIRKSSIDEYPQLLNVLRGEMSIVGPRPMLPSERNQIEPYAEVRFSVKPGLTGLWQISGRKNVSSLEAMKFDVQYVQTMTPWLDLLILLSTPWAMLSGRGAS